MDRSKLRWVTLVVGIMLSAVGAIWALQGVGMIGGSSMSGEERWLVMGAMVGALGVGLLYRSLTARP